MKTYCFVLLTLTFFSAGNMFGDELPSDNHFFSMMSAALTVSDLHSWAALSLDNKRTNAQALYLLDVKASQTDGLSNSVRLAVLASTVETWNRYMVAISHSTSNMEGFIHSSGSTATLFLLEDSLKTLASISAPHVYLNVWSPGIAAAGMDPANIPDSKARAECARRIAANNQAIEEGNARIRIQNCIVSLKEDIKGILRDVPPGGKVESFREEIRTSGLPVKVKAEILNKDNGGVPAY